MQELGYNYRLTDIQAALGCSQLNRAEKGLTRRRDLAERYLAEFSGKAFLHREIQRDPGHAYHLFVAEFENRNELYQYLRDNQIFAQVHYIPLHLMPYYRQQGWGPGDLPHVEEYYRHGLSLPLYPSLTVEEQDRVIQTIIDFYR
jgi:dTDP-4-amino-4,6-dideoxygalactose transaminase